jgi:hypothetical protein
MASPFQQQVRQRKLIYIALILVLFTVSMVWRRTVIDAQAKALSIREEARGEVELTGAVVRLGLTGSRGLAICVLWNAAIDKQKMNQWNEMEVLVRSLTKLQPHFITPWLFQSWNLAYNVSVESDRVRDKYFYVTRGVELLAEGERQNRNHPDLRWAVGFYMQHKICRSDETNYQRSLFQLSLIPPNERDPARFWKQTDEGPVLNWAELHKFCQEHPQLVRRLHEGMHRDSLREKKRQFACQTPEEIIRFLEENYQVPGLYRVALLPEGQGGELRAWDVTKKDELVPPGERFPPLPPPRAGAFDPEALSSDTTLGDDTDAHGAAQAWFAYAQEPIPAPDVLPGSTQPITDPARQRRPRNITTLIFRDYPAQGRRFMAERFQEEGWFDDEPYDASDLFERTRDPELAGREIKVGGEHKWSEDAWKRAAQAWRKHGEENHLLFDSEAAEQNKRELSRRFARRYGIKPDSSPPKLREDAMSPSEKEEYEAARFIFEYNFYRQVSNFHHHYIRCFVESNPETVAARKLLFKAERLNLSGSPDQALDVYQTAVEVPAWRGRKLTPLEAWRDLVLLRNNKDFRRDSFTQEQSAEYQIRYLLVYNRHPTGQKLKKDIGQMATLLPLVPKVSYESFRPPIIGGPLDVTDPDGKPLIDEATLDLTIDRMYLPPRKPRAPAPDPSTMQPITPKSRPATKKE